MKIDIYQFRDAREFLKSQFENFVRNNSQMTLSKWAGEMGYANASTLSAVFRGVRPFGLKVRNNLKYALRLDESEQIYFDLMANYSDAKDEKKRQFFSEILDSHSVDDAIRMKAQRFQMIAEWWHFAVMEYLKTKGNHDTEHIVGFFKDVVHPNQIKLALTRLERLGLVKLEKSQWSPIDCHFDAGDSGSSSAVRKHHQGLLDLGATMLSENSIDRRDYRGTTICIEKNQWEEAKRIVQSCHKQLSKLGVKRGDDVVVFHSQLNKLGRNK